MVNKAGNLGRIGENGIVNHLNLWFDDPDMFGPRRIRSRGSNDEGDIGNIPLTAIECKNYKKPVLTALMNNAREKAERAKRPVWWLTVKKKRKSVANAGQWYAGTDLEQFLSLLAEPMDDDDLIALVDAKQYIYVISDIGDFEGRYKNRYPAPEFQWKAVIVGDGRNQNALNAVDETQQWFDESFDELREEAGTDRIIPLVLVKGAGANPEHMDGWYVLTSVHWMCRILESMGILPQNLDEYDESSEVHWQKFWQTRYPEFEI